MLIYVNGVKTDNYCGLNDDNQNIICLAAYEEINACLSAIFFDIGKDYVNDLIKSTRYENHSEYDFICVNKPKMGENDEDAQPVSLFFTHNKVAIISDNKKYENAIEAIIDKHPKDAAVDMVLYYFFNNLFLGDSAYLENIEDYLASLEVEAIKPRPVDITEELFEIRKNLLELKRYYEATFDLLQDLEENLNDFFTKTQIRRFRIHTNKADRLSNYVNSLREHATQVREAYQNQLDISLNETMKVFTVITAIFLPLTLIAGWYGMNLKMPEYGHNWAYPLVITVSVIIVVVLLVFFKKKKWY